MWIILNQIIPIKVSKICLSPLKQKNPVSFSFNLEFLWIFQDNVSSIVYFKLLTLSILLFNVVATP